MEQEQMNMNMNMKEEKQKYEVLALHAGEQKVGPDGILGPPDMKDIEHWIASVQQEFGHSKYLLLAVQADVWPTFLAPGDRNVGGLLDRIEVSVLETLRAWSAARGGE
jgi:hypothetical protein